MPRRKIEEELAVVGCHLTREQFYSLLEEQKALTSPAWSIDDLVCHPREALLFCEHIRRVTACRKMSDNLILRGLLNARRNHGELSTSA